MSGQQAKFNWKFALSAIAISVGTFSISSSPAQAAPVIANSFELAQVGVRSRINAPTPLNLTPRTHIPLPTNSRSRDYYGYPGYGGSRRGSYRNQGYGGHYRGDHHHSHHRGNRRRKGTVIIINPATSSSSSYSSYSNDNGYIQIIRK